MYLLHLVNMTTGYPKFSSLLKEKKFRDSKSFAKASPHRTTKSNTLQGYVISVMDSERGYLEYSLLYMERRFNIYSIICRYLQLFDDVFKILHIYLIH